MWLLGVVWPFLLSSSFYFCQIIGSNIMCLIFFSSAHFILCVLSLFGMRVIEGLQCSHLPGWKKFYCKVCKDVMIFCFLISKEKDLLLPWRASHVRCVWTCPWFCTIFLQHIDKVKMWNLHCTMISPLLL